MRYRKRELYVTLISIFFSPQGFVVLHIILKTTVFRILTVGVYKRVDDDEETGGKLQVGLFKEDDISFEYTTESEPAFRQIEYESCTETYKL